jgi:type III pantothenate kinase
MILTIDIGNSNIIFGGFIENELKFVARMATDTTRTSDEYASNILSILALHNVQKKEIKGAIISSVVPPLNRVIKKAVRLIYISCGSGTKGNILRATSTPSSAITSINMLTRTTGLRTSVWPWNELRKSVCTY